MDQGPLVIEQIDAAAKFLAEFEKKLPVMTAFWLKTGEEASWYLYVAPDEFDHNTVDVPYREVIRLAGEMRDPNFDPFQVKIIKPSDPLAKAALDFHQRFPGRTPIRLHQRYFGGISADEVYIYPTPITVSS